MIVSIGGSKRLVVGGFVGVNEQNRKLAQVVVGVGGKKISVGDGQAGNARGKSYLLRNILLRTRLFILERR